MNGFVMKLTLATLGLAFGATCVSAQSLTPLNVTSGYDFDLIADGAGSAASSTSGSFDGSNVFYDSTYLSNHEAGSNSGVLVVDTTNTEGSDTTITGNSGTPYVLAPVAADNVVYLNSSETSGALNFTPTSGLAALDVLGSSADGSSVIGYTLNFSGGATSSGTLTFPDWYDPSASGEVTDLSHVSTGDSYSPQGNSFSLYDELIAVPQQDQSLALDSISFTFDGSSSTGAIFAVTAQAVPEPDTFSAMILGALFLGLAFWRRRGLNPSPQK
jgi:hypothetical protein